jgi:hypothetical protein
MRGTPPDITILNRSVNDVKDIRAVQINGWVNGRVLIGQAAVAILNRKPEWGQRSNDDEIV